MGLSAPTDPLPYCLQLEHLPLIGSAEAKPPKSAVRLQNTETRPWWSLPFATSALFSENEGFFSVLPASWTFWETAVLFS